MVDQLKLLWGKIWHATEFTKRICKFENEPDNDEINENEKLMEVFNICKLRYDMGVSSKDIRDRFPRTVPWDCVELAWDGMCSKPRIECGTISETQPYAIVDVVAKLRQLLSCISVDQGFTCFNDTDGGSVILFFLKKNKSWNRWNTYFILRKNVE